MRTAGITNQELKTKSKETQNVTKQNLTEKGKKSQESLESIIGYCVNQQSDSLIPITEDKHMFNNIDCFHNSNEYKIKQCTVCLEAWPMKSSSRSQKDSEYQCVRCNRDKKTPQKIFKTKLHGSFCSTFSTSRTHPNRRNPHCMCVSGTFLLILLFFWTVINSLQFKAVEPSVLF